MVKTQDKRSLGIAKIEMINTFSYSDAAARVRGVLTALAFLVCFSAAALAADSVTGTVRNQTRGGTVAGDDVILLRLDQGMQEESRTKSDAQGAFTFKLQSPDKLYLVRAVHRGVNYDQRAMAGNTLAIDVFDAAAKVQGVRGTHELIRAGTKANAAALHVSDMIEIRNDSNPPLTQAGERTFEVFLPPKAKLTDVLASSVGRLAVVISASPVAGEPGHYTVNYPLRPGATHLAFNYDLPYDGHAAFHPRLAYAMQELTVMIPAGMKFTSNSPAFQAVNTGAAEFKAQVANLLEAGAAPGFEISGAGAIPELQSRSQARPGPQVAPNPGTAGQAPAVPPTNSFARQTQAPAPAQGGQTAAAPAPATPAAAVSSRDWWILGGAAFLVLGTCGFLIWRTSRRPRLQVKPARAAGSKPAGSPSTPLLETLKEELLELETSRLEGSISGAEYDKAKQALQGNLERALARAAAKP